ncbi:TadE/TadG family type IV pilus assembly protein [Pseudogemmobacter sp. W21_MBD1_M6]|uniref:TadE/TadG family type IV pilus assembly protein n=1 Tax=Pseudogemmobacter sp. W21_MBD1_M6 TaxID=3240271 RepID=UPI003F975DA1
MSIETRTETNESHRQTATAPVTAHRPAPSLRRFRADESGSLIIFGIFMLILMLLAGGMAVDLMRFETSRTKMQNTLDRAVLAGADLDQPLNSKAVVEDYFLKAGMSGYLVNVVPDNGMNYRKVSANSRARVPTMFLRLPEILGLPSINQFSATASGAAEERIGNVEISLVLDVSGSMNQLSSPTSKGIKKISRLHTAAEDFLNKTFDTIEPGKLSMSIVPYSSHVAAGQTLLGYFNIDGPHTNSACLDFAADSFDTVALPMGSTQKQTSHFDATHWYYTNSGATAFVYAFGNSACPNKSSVEITPFGSVKSTLVTKVKALTAGGNTSIDVGIKWGAALLDPSTQAMAPSGFAGRPVAYSDKETLKVIVVMTDGVNTERNEMIEPYRAGPSVVWKNNTINADNVNAYSMYDAGRDQYWIPALNKWRDEPYGNYSKTTCTTTNGYWKWDSWRGKYVWVDGSTSCNTEQDPGYPNGAAQWTYQTLWASANQEWIIEKLFRAAWPNKSLDQWKDLIAPLVDANTMNTQMGEICTAAKQKGIVVYTIGFETSPTAPQTTLLKNCASTPSHFFNVNGADLSSAFSAIASSITLLRLIQ